MEREWSLERYREFNDRLARRVAMDENDLKNFAKRGLAAQQAVDAVIPVVDAKLILHRLRKLAVHISSQAGVDVRERASMLRELNELADQVEEQFELLGIDGFR